MPAPVLISLAVYQESYLEKMRCKKIAARTRQVNVDIPALTTAQMVEVDRLMMTGFGIGLIQMMENAGRSLAELSNRMLGDSLFGRSVCVLCGRGNKGGGGMVAARHLHNRSAEVHIIRLEGELKGAPTHQWNTLRKMGFQNEPDFDLSNADIILDALIGYGIQGDPRPEIAVWIEKANAAGKPVLALDAPSGLDTTSGMAGRPKVWADATIALALPKLGLMSKPARPFVGELYLADIGVPPELYRQLGLEVGNIFDRDTIIKIRE
jgi:NAD(P)H-hydrate epimerase